jgi:hypothetical protein
MIEVCCIFHRRQEALMSARNSSTFIALLTILLVLAPLAISGEAPQRVDGMAHVRFILTGLNVTGTPGEPARPSKTVQRTQFLVFTLSGGTPPWSVTPTNNIVSATKTAENVFKIAPNSLGDAVVEVYDSRGYGKVVDVKVIEDKYGADTAVFNNNNGSGVSNGPRANTTFSISVGYKITQIQTYHYNSGQGKPAGTISLKNNTDGRQYGPWPTTQVSKFYWVVKPQVNIANGTYTVIDSDPASWSYNAQSGNAGFVTINGMPRLPN